MAVRSAVYAMNKRTPAINTPQHADVSEAKFEQRTGFEHIICIKTC